MAEVTEIRFLVDDNHRLHLSVLDCISATWDITAEASRKVLHRAASMEDGLLMKKWCVYRCSTLTVDFAFADPLVRFLITTRRGDQLWRSESTRIRWHAVVQNVRNQADPFPNWAERNRLIRQRPFRLGDSDVSPLCLNEPTPPHDSPDAKVMADVSSTGTPIGIDYAQLVLSASKRLDAPIDDADFERTTKEMERRAMFDARPPASSEAAAPRRRVTPVLLSK